MRLLIIGATGFIGRELIKELEKAGHSPVAVSRDTVKAAGILGSRAEIIEWDGKSAEALAEKITGFEAIINLAGENIASGRWTSSRKKLITESRVKTGHLLTEAVMLSSEKPAILIQGSAIGYYGTPVNMPADENQPAGKGFIAELTRDWESSIAPLGKIIPRIVILRTGLVLGNDGGLLKKMILPFSLYSGAVIGSGRQWMSWIHIRDEVRAICFLLENPSCSGAYNMAAPNPVIMKTFMSLLGKILKKPVWLRVPGFFLKIALGKMAEETVLASQHIYPGKLLKAGFEFEYHDLTGALENLLIKK